MSSPSLHHIGYVVASIAESGSGWLSSLGAATLSASFDDPIQRVRVAFLSSLDGSDDSAIQIELVEPLSKDSPVARFLEAKGGGLHHLCYEVDDLEVQIRRMKRRGAMLIRSPRPAIAFDGRRICWLLTHEGLLIEYLERRNKPNDGRH